MVFSYITNIIELSKYNNKIIMLTWILFTIKIFRYVSLFYLILGILASFKFIYFMLIKEAQIYPSKKILDSIIYKIILGFFLKKKIWNLLNMGFFLIFAYLILIVTSFSLKSFQLSIITYNCLKYTYYCDTNLLSNLHTTFKNDLLTKIDLTYEFKYRNINIKL